MTEQRNSRKHRRPARAALVAAAAVALMAVGVSAASTEAVQELFYQITTVVKVDQFRQDLTTSQGEQVTVFSVPEVQLEDRDGRAILVVDGEETDITDALAADGRYVHQRETEGTRLEVAVEGSAQDWEMTVEIGVPGGEPLTYSYTMDSQGRKTLPEGASVGQEGADGEACVSAALIDGENFSGPDAAAAGK